MRALAIYSAKQVSTLYLLAWVPRNKQVHQHVLSNIVSDDTVQYSTVRYVTERYGKVINTAQHARLSRVVFLEVWAIRQRFLKTDFKHLNRTMAAIGHTLLNQDRQRGDDTIGSKHVEWLTPP